MSANCYQLAANGFDNVHTPPCSPFLRNKYILSSSMDLELGASLPVTVSCDPVLSLNTLKKKGLTDEHLNKELEEKYFPELADCFENVHDYLEKLPLKEGQKTDVRAEVNQNGTQAGWKKALRLWRKLNPIAATYGALLEIVLSLQKGDVAIKICEVIRNIGE